MKTGIYMIRNKINDKKYIGQAVDIDFRWEQHIRELNSNQKYYNPHLQNAWNKYGADNFEFTIICLCEEDELDEFEIDMIAHYHTFYKDGGYNLTLGGDGTKGYIYSDEQRVRRSEIKKEYYKDPENIKKASEAWKGDKNPMKRPEVKRKHSEIMKGKNAKAVYCVNNDTVYASGKEAGKKLDIDCSCISWCCKGKNILPEYPDGHHKKKGRFKDSPIYEFWYLSEYEEKFGKVAI